MPKGRPSDELLDGWIKELFPPGRFPEISDEAKDYLENILKDRIDKFSPTVSGWQYVAAQLSAIAYEYALQREKLSNMIGETEEVLIQKRQQVAKMQEILETFQSIELDDTTSETAANGKQMSEKWEKKIDELIDANDGNYKAVIKQSILECKEKSNQIKAMISLTKKAGFDENIEKLISKIEGIRNPKPEPLLSPMPPRLGQETTGRTRGQSDRDFPQTTPPANKRRSTSAGPKNSGHKFETFDQDQKFSTRSNIDLTRTSKINRLQNCDINYFYGTRGKAPYGEDFNMFLKLFERFADGVNEQIKLDELIKRLKGDAFTFLTNANNADLNFSYEMLVRSLKAVFFKVETSTEKRYNYENLRQRDDEHLEIFQIRFENHFKEYYTLISGPESSLMTDEVFKCNQFYTRIRETLRKQLGYRKQIILEEKDTLKWEDLITELRKIEKEYPAKRAENKPSNNNNKQPSNQGQNQNQNQNQKQRGSFNQNRGNSNRQQYPQNRGSFNNQSRSGPQNQQPQSQANQQPQSQVNRPRNCFNCNQEGHMARDCKAAPRNPNHQPLGNTQNAPQRGNNRGRGGSNSNRGGRGNFRGNNRQGHMNLAQDADDQQWEEDHNNFVNEENITATTCLSYAEQLAQNYMGVQFDPDQESLMHTLSSRKLDQVVPEKEVPFFSLAAVKYAPEENPDWTLKTAKEDTVRRIKNLKGWTKSVAKKQTTMNRTVGEKKTLESVKHFKWRCIDNARLVIPLIIEGVCIEDVVPDTGSQYNAISMNAFWALVGRFPAWEKAFEYSTTWEDEGKVIMVAGGREIGILGITRLFVQVTGGKEIPIYWAIYEDVEPTIILGTKGLRDIGMTMKSPYLGDANILVGAEDLHDAMEDIFMAAISTAKVEKTPKTPSDVMMQSDQSVESPMEEAPPQHRSLFERDMAHWGLEELEIIPKKPQPPIDKPEWEPVFYSSGESWHSEYENQPGTSFRMEARDQDFRERWDRWRSPERED